MNQKRKKIFIITFAVTLFVILAVYFVFCYYFQTHFYFRSYINGINYSNKTVSEVEAQITEDVDDYVLKLEGRNDVTDIITADDIDYEYVSDGSVEALMESQNSFKWIFSLFSQNSNDMQVTTNYDTEKLENAIKSLSFFDSDNVIEPTDATAEFKDDTYEIVPEEQGAQVDEEILSKAIVAAIENGDTKLILDDNDCYEEPSITSESDKLKSLVTTLNQYIGVTITYDFSYATETVDASYIHEWLNITDDMEVEFDLEKVRSYIDTIAPIYNTWGKTRDFTNHDGDVIEVSGGDYGWLIDRSSEVEHLVETIQAGKDATIEPIYSQSAHSREKNDIGDSYVEIDLTMQHVWVYENGELVIDTDCVTGNSSKGYDTPSGIYQITYKEKNATLTGENYSSDVTYWMPFFYNVGLHDASWRSSSEFGGTTYKTNGSHGCVNLPPSAAATIFEHVEKGTPVVIYES